MDQVLFSEPSEKMKQKIAARRQQELTEQQQEVEAKKKQRVENLSSDEDPAQKLLNDKFGNNQ